MGCFESSRVLDENARDEEKSKHQAAEELVTKSKKIASEISALLGKKKKDSFEKLIEYVGADGKYISITKSVTVYYPKDYLKGVEIVDTPGFNDPIVSREERTKEFLKSADAVLMLLYAGQPFSSTDKSIIFDTVRGCGVAKILMGVNKYDIPYEQGEDINEVCAYVKRQVLEACKSCQGEAFAETLSELEPLPVSANMALLSQLDMSKIQNSRDLTFDLNRYYDIFEISNQKDLFTKSKFGEFEQKLIEAILKNKEEILFKKPISMVEGCCIQKLQEMEKELLLREETVKNCSLSDDDLENKKTQLERAIKRINKKIDGFGFDIEDSINENVRRAENEIKDEIDSTINKLNRYVNESVGLMTSGNEVVRTFKDRIFSLESKAIPRIIECKCDEIKIHVKKELNAFVDNVADIMQRYLPDVDSDDVLKSIRLNFEEFSEIKTTFDSIHFESVGFFRSFLDGLTFGYTNKARLQEWCYNFIDKMQHIDISTYLSAVKNAKGKIIDIAKKPIMDMLLPMQEQLDKILSDVNTKDAKIQKAQNDAKLIKEKLNSFKQKAEIIKKKKIELSL